MNKEEYYSQHGEEEVINKYLNNIQKGKYIDIGTGDPIKFSNTYYFYKKGWKGLIIEPYHKHWEDLKKVRPNDTFLPIAITNYNGIVKMYDTATDSSWIGKDYKARLEKGLNTYPYTKVEESYAIECMTMKELLKKYPDFINADFISIDIETNEDKLLSKCDFSIFKPKLICIEYKVRGIDQRPKWEHYLKPYYTLVKFLEGNAFYLRNSEYEKLKKEIKVIPQYEPSFDESEQEDMNEYMKSGAWLIENKKTKELENKIKEFLGVKHCIMVNNGTISLSLALLAVGVKPGDKVAVPDLTMIATINAVKLIGAIPILVDVLPDSLTMDVQNIQNGIKLKAVIYVSLNGRWDMTGKLGAFIYWCKANRIPIIEDAAPALGSKSYRSMIGNDPQIDITSFSFSPAKIITTGQGGCLTTNNDKLADKIRRLKNFGRLKGGHDTHDYFGINAKFTDIQAVIGLAQMKKLKDRIAKKKEIYNLYYEELKNVKQIEFIPTDLALTTPWFVDIYTKHRNELMNYLEKNKIKTRKIYAPIHTQQSCSDLIISGVDFPIANKYSTTGLWLPSAVTLTNEEVIYVCQQIKEFFK